MAINTNNKNLKAEQNDTVSASNNNTPVKTDAELASLGAELKAKAKINNAQSNTGAAAEMAVPSVPENQNAKANLTSSQIRNFQSKTGKQLGVARNVSDLPSVAEVLDSSSNLSNNDIFYKNFYEQWNGAKEGKNAYPSLGDSLRYANGLKEYDNDNGTNYYLSFQQNIAELISNPNSPSYMPYYLGGTNANIRGTLEELGIQPPANITSEYIDELSRYVDYSSVKYGVDGTPSSSGSANQKLAYCVYKLRDHEADTVKAETQWSNLQRLISAWVKQGYSDRDIEKMAANAVSEDSDFSYLRTMDERASSRNPVALNRAVLYNKEAIQGTIYAARNGGDIADVNNNIAMYYAGAGTVYTPNTNSEAAHDRTSEWYMPYGSGASFSMDKLCARYGVNTFSRDWLEKNKEKLIENKDYETIEKSIVNAEKAQEEKNRLKAFVDRLIEREKPKENETDEKEYAKSADEIIAEVRKQLESNSDYSTLAKMEQKRSLSGSLDLAYSVYFALPYFEKEIRDKVEDRDKRLRQEKERYALQREREEKRAKMDAMLKDPDFAAGVRYGEWRDSLGKDYNAAADEAASIAFAAGRDYETVYSEVKQAEHDKAVERFTVDGYVNAEDNKDKADKVADLKSGIVDFLQGKDVDSKEARYMVEKYPYVFGGVMGARDNALLGSWGTEADTRKYFYEAETQITGNGDITRYNIVGETPIANTKAYDALAAMQDANANGVITLKELADFSYSLIADIENGEDLNSAKYGQYIGVLSDMTERKAESDKQEKYNHLRMSADGLNAIRDRIASGTATQEQESTYAAIENINISGVNDPTYKGVISDVDHIRSYALSAKEMFGGDGDVIDNPLRDYIKNNDLNISSGQYIVCDTIAGAVTEQIQLDMKLAMANNTNLEEYYTAVLGNADEETVRDYYISLYQDAIRSYDASAKEFFEIASDMSDMLETRIYEDQLRMLSEDLESRKVKVSGEADESAGFTLSDVDIPDAAEAIGKGAEAAGNQFLGRGIETVAGLAKKDIVQSQMLNRAMFSRSELRELLDEINPPGWAEYDGDVYNFYCDPFYESLMQAAKEKYQKIEEIAQTVQNDPSFSDSEKEIFNFSRNMLYNGMKISENLLLSAGGKMLGIPVPLARMLSMYTTYGLDEMSDFNVKMMSAGISKDKSMLLGAVDGAVISLLEGSDDFLFPDIKVGIGRKTAKNITKRFLGPVAAPDAARKVAVSNVVKKYSAVVLNLLGATADYAANTGINMASEGAAEYLQGVAGGYFSNELERAVTGNISAIDFEGAKAEGKQAFLEAPFLTAAFAGINYLRKKGIATINTNAVINDFARTNGTSIAAARSLIENYREIVTNPANDEAIKAAFQEDVDAENILREFEDASSEYMRSDEVKKLQEDEGILSEAREELQGMTEEYSKAMATVDNYISRLEAEDIPSPDAIQDAQLAKTYFEDVSKRYSEVLEKAEKYQKIVSEEQERYNAAINNYHEEAAKKVVSERLMAENEARLKEAEEQERYIQERAEEEKRRKADELAKAYDLSDRQKESILKRIDKQIDEIVRSAESSKDKLMRSAQEALKGVRVQYGEVPNGKPGVFDAIRDGAGNVYGAAITVDRTASLEDIARFILPHEFVHLSEQSALFDRLRNTVFEAQYGNDQSARDIAVQNKMEELANEGVPSTRADAESELVAELVTDYLFSDDKRNVFKLLEDGSQNVFQRMYEYLSDKAAELVRDKESRAAYSIVNRLRREFKKALWDAVSNTPMNGDANYSEAEQAERIAEEAASEELKSEAAAVETAVSEREVAETEAPETEVAETEAAETEAETAVPETEAETAPETTETTETTVDSVDSVAEETNRVEDSREKSALYRKLKAQIDKYDRKNGIADTDVTENAANTETNSETGNTAFGNTSAESEFSPSWYRGASKTQQDEATLWNRLQALANSGDRKAYNDTLDELAKLLYSPNTRDSAASPAQIVRTLYNSLGKAGVYQSQGVKESEDVPDESMIAWYDEHSGALMTTRQNIGNMSVMMYGAGREVQRILDIQVPSDMVSPADVSNADSFAKFFYDYVMSKSMTPEEAAFVPQFEQALKEKGIDKYVEDARHSLNVYQNASVAHRISANIVNHMPDYRNNGSVRSKFNQFFDEFRAKVLDSTFPLQRADDIVGGNRLRTEGAYLPYADRKADMIMTDRMVDINGNTIGESFKSIMERNGVDSAEKENLMATYIVAVMEIQRDANGKPLFDEAAGDMPSVDDARETVRSIENSAPNIAQCAKEYSDNWYKFLKAWAVENGLLSEAEYKLFRKDYPFYFPMLRYESNDHNNLFRGIKKPDTMVAHNLPIVDPVLSMNAMLHRIVNKANRNRIAQEFDSMYVNNRDMSSIARAVPTENATTLADDSNAPGYDAALGLALEDSREKIYSDRTISPKTVVTVYYKTEHPDDARNTRVYEFIDEDIANFINGCDRPEKIGWLRTAGFITHAMTALTTGKNILFSVKNAIRDFQKSVDYGSWASTYADGAAKWLKTFATVAGNEIKIDRFDFKLMDTAWYNDYKALGGGEWERMSFTKGEKNARKVIDELTGKKTPLPLRIVESPIAFTDWINKVIETTSRAAEYRYGAQETNTPEGKRQAFMNAMEVTTDFNRSGNSRLAYAMRQLIPFANATLQGTYQQGRMFSRPERSRLPARLAKTITSQVIFGAASALLTSFFGTDKDKEDWNDLPSYLKSNYFMIPNFFGDEEYDFLRFPVAVDPLSKLSYNLGLAIGCGAVELDAFSDSVLSTVKSIIEDALPEGSLIAPLHAVRENRSWNGNDIVASYLTESDLNETQWFYNSTPDAFIQASQIVNDVTMPFARLFDKNATGGIAISPIYLQYLAQQYSGVIGQLLIPAFKKNSYTGEIDVIGGALDAVKRNFLVDADTSNIVDDVFEGQVDLLNEIVAAGKKGYRANMLKGGLTKEQAQECYETASAMLKSGGAFYEAQEKIKALNNEISAAENNRSLTEAERDILVESKRYEMRKVQKDAIQAGNEQIMNPYVVSTNALDAFRSKPYIVPMTEIEKLEQKYQSDLKNGMEYMEVARDMFDRNPTSSTMLPKPPTSFTVNDEKVDVPGPAKELISETYYDAYVTAAEQAINDGFYDKTDDEKADAWKKVHSQAQQAARKAFLAEYGELLE